MPIGEGQTISQPYIVGWMTELIEPNKKMRVLEIGTGSGYQAAVLAECVGEVVPNDPSVTVMAAPARNHRFSRSRHVKLSSGICTLEPGMWNLQSDFPAFAVLIGVKTCLI